MTKDTPVKLCLCVFLSLIINVKSLIQKCGTFKSFTYNTPTSQPSLCLYHKYEAHINTMIKCNYILIGRKPAHTVSFAPHTDTDRVSKQ